MPTPACLATAVIGAPGSATNTARADSRMRWSLRAASAWRPPGRPAGRPSRGARPIAVGAAEPGLGVWLGFGGRLGLGHRKRVTDDWNKAFRSDNLGTEGFV